MQLNDTRFCNFSFIYIFTENQSPDSKHATKVDFTWEILPWGILQVSYLRHCQTSRMEPFRDNN